MNLVKKADYNTKTSEIEKKRKYLTIIIINISITIQEFNKLTSENFEA